MSKGSVRVRPGSRIERSDFPLSFPRRLRIVRIVLRSFAPVGFKATSVVFYLEARTAARVVPADMHRFVVRAERAFTATVARARNRTGLGVNLG